MTDNHSTKRSPLEIAQVYLNVIPAPSALFTSSVRAIRKAMSTMETYDSEELRDLTASSAHFLVNVSPTLKTVFYKAAEEIYPEELNKIENITVKCLLMLFSPGEVCSILSSSYLYRHLRKKCEDSEFKRIVRKTLLHMEIGAIVGRTIKHIGYGNGLLIGAFRGLSHAIFSLVDQKKYVELRRKLEKQDKVFSSEWEHEGFGCSTVEISAGLARMFGYGLGPSLGLGAAGSGPSEEAAPEALAEEVLCWRVAFQLAACFHETGTAPAVAEDSELFLPPEEATTMERQCFGVLRDGPKLTWLTVPKGDLPEKIKEALEISASTQPAEGIEEMDEGEQESSL